MTFTILLFGHVYMYLLFGEDYHKIFTFKLLFTDKPDDFILECVRWLNDDNLFAVNVTIHLSEYLANEGVVAGFVFLVTRDELLKGGTLNEDTIFSPYSKNLPVIHFKFLKFGFMCGNNHSAIYIYAPLFNSLCFYQYLVVLRHPF